MLIRPLAIVLGSLSLAACVATESSLDQNLNELDRLDDLLFEEFGGETSGQVTPTTGSASYEGIFISASNDAIDQASEDQGGDLTEPSAIITSGDPLALIGQMSLDVDFGSGVVEGEATDILSGSGEALAGSLDYNASMTGQDSFDGEFNGSVEFGDGETFSYGSMQVDGSFRGPAAEAVFALGRSEFTLEGESIPFAMGFLAEMVN